MLKLIQAEPTAEPVSLEDAKAHLVVEHSEDDYLISQMVSAARKHAEARCNRVIVRQKWRLYFDWYLQDFKLSPETVQEVEQIQYIDIDGVTQTVSSSVYSVDVPRQCVFEAYGQTWPAARYQENCAWADVWSGYYKTDSSPIDQRQYIPEDLKFAILMLVDDMYAHRGKGSEFQIYANETFNFMIQSHVVYANG